MLTVFAILAGWAVLATAGQKKKEDQALATVPYIATPEAAQPTLGSLWIPSSGLGNLATDYKARQLNDLITIRIVEQTVSSADGSLKSDRKFQTQSGISSIFGQLSATNRLQNLLGGQSQTSLSGDASSSSTTQLTTTLAGRVIQVFPNGNLRIEASRQLELNNQHQTAVLRGIVRPGDIAPDNSVLSSSLSDLQIQLRGKGVVSDTIRPPNPVVRLLLRLLTF